MKTVETKVVLTIGDKVAWRHVPGGGYGFVSLVPARIVKIGPKRVQIAALLDQGGERLVWVKPENLRWPQ